MHLRVYRCEHDLPVQEWLQRRLPAAPGGYLGKLLKSGKILVDGQPSTAGQPLVAGSAIRLPDSARLRELAAAAPPLVVLAETPGWLALAKPAGVPVHPTAEDEADLTGTAQNWLRRRGLRCRVAPVHRLDRGTSGVVILAKGRKAASELGKSLMAGTWRKTYLALVAGQPPATGILDRQVHHRGRLRPARAGYRVLGRSDRFSLLALDLETGRGHQLRVQLAGAGWPIVGDGRYGGPQELGARPCLHCLRVDIGAAPDVLAAPLPEDLRRILAELGPFSAP
ncbi:MAG: RluA family pseudouridine synthase [Geothermobacteraceae bacterium]